MSTVGRQPDGSWVLNADIIVAPDGESIEAEDCPYIWVGYLHEGPSLAKPSEAVPVCLPLSSQSLHPLVDALRSILGHTFFPWHASVGSMHHGIALPSHTGQVSQLSSCNCFWEFWNGKNHSPSMWASLGRIIPQQVFLAGEQKRSTSNSAVILLFQLELMIRHFRRTSTLSALIYSMEQKVAALQEERRSLARLQLLLLIFQPPQRKGRYIFNT